MFTDTSGLGPDSLKNTRRTDDGITFEVVTLSKSWQFINSKQTKHLSRAREQEFRGFQEAMVVLTKLTKSWISKSYSLALVRPQCMAVSRGDGTGE